MAGESREPRPAEAAVAVAHTIPEALLTRRFVLACAVHFSGGMALSFYILFPLFIRRLGGSELTIGVYAGIMGAAAVAARLPVGRFLDTQGRRRVLAAAGVLHVASWLGFAWIDRLGTVAAVLVVAHGAAGGALFAAYFTYASDITPVTRRSEGIAMFGIWGMLPNGLGPALGEFLIARGGFTAFFLVAAVLAFVSLNLSLLLPETATPAHTSARRDVAGTGRFSFRGMLFLLWTTFVFGAAVNSLFTFLAPFAYAEGRGGVGSFFMSYALTAVAVRVFTGRLPDRVGLRRVLIPALFLLGAGVVCVPYAHVRSALVLVGAICGVGHGYAFPILNVMTVDRVSPQHRGRAVSWFTAMFDLGNTLANPILGGVAEWAGYRTMFSATGLAVLVAASAVWHRRPSGAQY